MFLKGSLRCGSRIGCEYCRARVPGVRWSLLGVAREVPCGCCGRVRTGRIYPLGSPLLNACLTYLVAKVAAGKKPSAVAVGRGPSESVFVFLASARRTRDVQALNGRRVSWRCEVSAIDPSGAFVVVQRRYPLIATRSASSPQPWPACTGTQPYLQGRETGTSYCPTASF